MADAIDMRLNEARAMLWGPKLKQAAIRVVSAHRAYPEDLSAAIDALSRVLCDADPQLATDAKD